jgi:hypothetical protein
MRTNTRRALLVACAAVIGCTSSGNEDAGAELGAGTGSVALFRLERFPSSYASGSTSADPQGATPRVVANAKIARFTGMDGSSVSKLLGVEVREGEGCTVSGRLDGFSFHPEARVELLSVGDISLRLGDRAQTLSPRLFPDLASTASGWFYAGHAELAPAESGVDRERSDGGLERESEYTLSAPGEQGIGRFELAIAAPGPVLGLELAGNELSLDQQAEGATLKRDADASLSWEPEDLRDQIEIELYAGGSVLSCTARDDGQFSVPQAKLALLEADPQASIVVRRVRVVPVELQGIESADVRFATTLNGALRVQ